MGFDDPRFIDLHIHSTASDGTLQPIEIIYESIKAGLSAISITDHDTIAGCGQVLSHFSPPPLDFLTGVEISAAPPPAILTNGSLHLLGYDIDIQNSELNRHLADLRAARNNRSPQIISRLADMGFDLTIEDVRPFSTGGQMGRPHIAQAMIYKGYVATVNEAFDKYIGKNGAAYVDKKRLPCELAIELITRAGGIPVLAHPGILNLPEDDDMKRLVALMADMGIKGIEVYYPGHSDGQISFFSALALEYRLLVTGGSDFHGDLNPEIQLGKGTGDLLVGYHIYEQLINFNRERLS